MHVIPLQSGKVGKFHWFEIIPLLIPSFDKCIDTDIDKGIDKLLRKGFVRALKNTMTRSVIIECEISL